MARLLANPKYPNTNGWQDRHNDAIVSATDSWPRQTGFEATMARLLAAWQDYAKDHKTRYDSPIGEDGVLGPAWEDIGDSLRTLLNGELGRLDGGTLDSFILDTMRENGVETENK